MAKKSSKRNLMDSDSDSSSDDSDSSSDDSFENSKRKKHAKNKHKKKAKSNKYDDSDSSEDDHRSSRNKKNAKRGRGGRRGGSSSSSEDDSSSSSDDDFSSRRTSKSSKKSKQKKRHHSPKRRSRSPRRPSASKTVEESMRQGRSILNSVHKTTDAEAQLSMNNQMNTLIAQLKQQRLEMEAKLKASEQEAAQLRAEKAQQHNGNNFQLNTINEGGGGGVEVATPESENSRVVAELEAVRKEREQMSKMIKKLESAKTDMESKLEKAKQEANVLKTENAASAQKVSQVTKEKEELKSKMEQIETTKTDIKSKLEKAEEEVNKLKQEKKSKTLEIRDMRGSVHNRSVLNEAEVERKRINQKLKQQELEREQMMHMMEQLEQSRARLQVIMSDSDDETESLTRTPPDSFQGGGGGRSWDTSPSEPFPDQVPRVIERERPALGRSGSNRSLRQLREEEDDDEFDTRPMRPSLLNPMMGGGRPTLGRAGKAQSMRNFDMEHSHNLGGNSRAFHQSMRNVSHYEAGGGMSGGFLGDQPRAFHQSMRNLGQYNNHHNNLETASYDGSFNDWDDSTLSTNRPSGWLGDTINRASNSVSNIIPAEPPSRTSSSSGSSKKKRDPSQHVRSIGIDNDYGNYKVRAKRDKAREAERKLRERLDRSRSPARLLDDDFV